MELRKGRTKIAVIARTLNRSYASVSVRLLKLGMRTRKGPTRRPGELREQIRKLCKPGRTDPEVARKLRVPVNLVWRVRKELGIPPGVTASEAGKRGLDVRRRLVGALRCFCCNKRCPHNSPSNREGWVIWKGIGLRWTFTEAYCPRCIKDYGLPTIGPTI